MLEGTDRSGATSTSTLPSHSHTAGVPNEAAARRVGRDADSTMTRSLVSGDTGSESQAPVEYSRGSQGPHNRLGGTFHLSY